MSSTPTGYSEILRQRAATGYTGEPQHAAPPVDQHEIATVLGEIVGLRDGSIPESERQRIMARKRGLIDRLDPDFYDRWPATDADDDASARRLMAELPSVMQHSLAKRHAAAVAASPNPHLLEPEPEPPVASLDRCPECGREISAHDDNGMQDEDGQRWCGDHAPEPSAPGRDEAPERERDDRVDGLLRRIASSAEPVDVMLLLHNMAAELLRDQGESIGRLRDFVLVGDVQDTAELSGRIEALSHAHDCVMAYLGRLEARMAELDGA